MYKQIGSLSNHWNGPQEREAHSTHHQSANHAKGMVKDKFHAEYHTISAEADDLDQKKKVLLEREELIKLCLDDIKANKHISPELTQEQEHLKTKCAKGKSDHQEWSSQKKELKAKIEAMKDSPIKLGCVHGNQPTVMMLLIENNIPLPSGDASSSDNIIPSVDDPDDMSSDPDIPYPFDNIPLQLSPSSDTLDVSSSQSAISKPVVNCHFNSQILPSHVADPALVYNFQAGGFDITADDIQAALGDDELLAQINLFMETF